MFSWDFFISHIFNLSPVYGYALLATISLAVIGQLVGVLVGSLVCAGRMSKNRILRLCSIFYIWFFRGVPELVLLVLLFSGIAAAGFYRFKDFSFSFISISASFQAAVVAIGLREGAYMSEIIRNGVQSVQKGQIEAARALGLSPRKVLWKVTVPQAMRVIVPPFGNEFNVMLKVTSLASVIGVPELFLTTQSYAATNFRIFSLFIGLAINYLLLTTAWSIIQTLIEARLRRHESGVSGKQSMLESLKAHLLGMQ